MLARNSFSMLQLMTGGAFADSRFYSSARSECDANRVKSLDCARNENCMRSNTYRYLENGANGERVPHRNFPRFFQVQHSIPIQVAKFVPNIVPRWQLEIPLLSQIKVFDLEPKRVGKLISFVFFFYIGLSKIILLWNRIKSLIFISAIGFS